MSSIFKVFGKKTLTYTASNTIVIQRAIPAKDFREATLLVRVFDNQMGSGSSVKVIAKAVAPTEDQPETDFADDTVLATATVDNTSGAATGKLVRAALSANFGGWVLVQLEATKGAGNCIATIDADIVFKD